MTHKTRTFTALYGGANYGSPTTLEPVAIPRTLDDALKTWRYRVDHYSYPCWGDPPATDEDGRWYGGFAWFVPDYHPAIRNGVLDTTDMHPDRVLVVGKRGGLHWECC